MLKVNLRTVFVSIIVSLLFVACSDNSVGVDENLNLDPELIQYSVMDAGDVVADLSDASTTQIMKWGDNVPKDRKGKFRKHRPGRLHLGQIFRELELTDNQKDQLKQILENHHSSAKEIHEDFKPKIQEILDQARAERQAILDRVKAGEITRDEAKDLIRQLNEDTRTQIENTDGFAEMKAELCDLKKILVADITGILSESQLVQWNDWLANLQDECLNS